ncbi:MAG: methyltransferase domain-containing protein, partial [Dinghuibacter sp.]|nr:methyltransferase domain-containing protein [Dinghuibacter sp.]
MSSNYYEQVAEYYNTTRNAYADGWDLNNSLALHYGYKDHTTKTFGDTLLRMNEVLMQAAAITGADKVLDAGCGIGGSSIYLVERTGCQCTGITLSGQQAAEARALAKKKGLEKQLDIELRNFMQTGYPDAQFTVVWGLESICYASDKAAFVREAYRLLQPGGRLVIADGMVTQFAHNEHPVIKKWLQGWQVNYLESPERFQQFFAEAGFTDIRYTDITRHTKASSRRLLLLYYGASMWGLWKKL